MFTTLARGVSTEIRPQVDRLLRLFKNVKQDKIERYVRKGAGHKTGMETLPGFRRSKVGGGRQKQDHARGPETTSRKQAR